MTFVCTVDVFSLCGGGFASLGAVDFSGGYVIHTAACASGFVAAAVVGHGLRATVTEHWRFSAHDKCQLT
jgi:ammonium transporter, Amt family